MTRKEIQEIALKALNLKVGDAVKIRTLSNTYFIAEESTKFYLRTENGLYSYYDIGDLLVCGFDKVEPKKKLGDMKCDDFCCKDCIFNCIECGDGVNLFDILEDTKKRLDMPEEIYLACKKLLDKEVEDEKTENSKKD